MIYKLLHEKLNIEQHEIHSGAPEGSIDRYSVICSDLLSAHILRPLYHVVYFNVVLIL